MLRISVKKVTQGVPSVRLGDDQAIDVCTFSVISDISLFCAARFALDSSLRVTAQEKKSI